MFGSEPARVHERSAAIVLAAGSSARMGIDKLWADLGGRPVVAWSLLCLAASADVDDIVVCVTDGSGERLRRLIDDLGVRATVVGGGAERQDSVRAGLAACEDAVWVVIHDAARPLLTPEMVSHGLEEALVTGAAIAAVPVTDTIKIVADQTIVSTPNRETLWAAQTPQVFRRELLLEAHLRASASVSDDAALVEALGVAVRVFPGAYGNIKITTPVDLRVAESLLMTPTALSTNEAPGTVASANE